MKSGGFRPIYVILILSFVLAGIGIFYQSKSENENKFTLTEKITKYSPKLKEVLSKNQNPIQLPPGATLLTRERIYTQDEIDTMSEEKFIEMVSDIERRLPKKSDIKELPPGALHQTPSIVIEAGRNLGAIKEVLKVHESYERNVTSFYERCSKKDETPTTVRALCLTNLILQKKKNSENLNLSQYPKEIVELSKIVIE